MLEIFRTSELNILIPFWIMAYFQDHTDVEMVQRSCIFSVNSDLIDFSLSVGIACIKCMHKMLHATWAFEGGS